MRYLKTIYYVRSNATYVVTVDGNWSKTFVEPEQRQFSTEDWDIDCTSLPGTILISKLVAETTHVVYHIRQSDTNYQQFWTTESGPLEAIPYDDAPFSL